MFALKAVLILNVIKVPCRKDHLEMTRRYIGDAEYLLFKTVNAIK